MSAITTEDQSPRRRIYASDLLALTEHIKAHCHLDDDSYAVWDNGLDDLQVAGELPFFCPTSTIKFWRKKLVGRKRPDRRHYEQVEQATADVAGTYATEDRMQQAFERLSRQIFMLGVWQTAILDHLTSQGVIITPSKTPHYESTGKQG